MVRQVQSNQVDQLDQSSESKESPDSDLIQDVKINNLTHSLSSYEKVFLEQIDILDKENFVQRFWQKDASLWTNKDEQKWLGWLDIISSQIEQCHILESLAKEIKEKNYSHAVLLGMGGSSLCVEVMRQTFALNSTCQNSMYPEMLVLDSVVPAQVKHVRDQIDPRNTIFIVASKSGSTTEPNVLCQYFYDETKKQVNESAGKHFIAITDPGSSMESRAKELGFAHIFYGEPTIGGRFSALSNFGMVPAAVMGLDYKKILSIATLMHDACREEQILDNPGVLLGAILGSLTKVGHDKVTIITSPGINSLGTWLEQLIAESTGKEGKGLIPVAGESLLEPDSYGKDRLFIYCRLENDFDKHQDELVEALKSAGQAVVSINIPNKLYLGAEFFRWEIATAVAGSVISINAFNQPNVQESKDFTKEYLHEYSEKGLLPENKKLYEETIHSKNFKLFADEVNSNKLDKLVSTKTLENYLHTFLSELSENNYFAINAYIECLPEMDAKLQIIRSLVQQKYKVATTVGFGPRFLHSTGQLHKGGPNTGVFLQITSDDKIDLAIPGEKFGFGILKQAQSLGDFKALSSRSRRLLRLHLGPDVSAQLDLLIEIFRKICLK